MVKNENFTYGANTYNRTYSWIKLKTMWQKCPVCNGTGTLPNYGTLSTSYCPTCQGTRIISEVNGLPPASVPPKYNTSTVTEEMAQCNLNKNILVKNKNEKDMNIMLGNLSVNQIEQRLGIDFPEEIREFMKQTHQSSANNIEEGKWHCFDIPFNLVCGDMETAVKIYDSVKEKTKDCKEALTISITNK